MKPPFEDAAHGNVLVEFFPAQRCAVEAEFEKAGTIITDGKSIALPES